MRKYHTHKLFNHCPLCEDLVNKATHYNKLDGEFIPGGEKKVQDSTSATSEKATYYCKRHCKNCGHDGYSYHELGHEAPLYDKCTNCKTYHFVRDRSTCRLI